MNIDSYLAIPYDIHNIDGLNCWGLVASIYNDNLNHGLKDFPSKTRSPREIAAIFSAAFADGSHGFKKTGNSEDYAVIVFTRNTSFGRLYHCGVMWKGRVLHCSHDAGGVVYQPVHIAALGFKGYEFWQK